MKPIGLKSVYGYCKLHACYTVEIRHFYSQVVIIVPGYMYVPAIYYRTISSMIKLISFVEEEDIVIN